MRRLLVALTAALLPALTQAGAQSPTAPDDPADPVVDVFLDCNVEDCFRGMDDHIRNEVEFVNWVRDRTVADVHLLITSQETGGGGEQYWLSFLGLRDYAGDSTTVRLNTQQTSTLSERRDRLTNRIAMGLVRYAVHTLVADQLEISMSPQDDDEQRAEAARATPARDPWNAWVFEVGIDGEMDGEVSQADTDFRLDLSANRTTQDWKLELEASGEYRRTRREVPDEPTILRIERDWSVDGFAARSIARLWSAGISARVGKFTFDNQDLAVRVAPAIEYSFLPYEEFSRRQITLRYSVGVNHWNYERLTVYNRLEESRWDQELALQLDFTRPWGSAETEFSGAHFLHDASRYRLSVDGEVDIRLFRGLTLDLGAGYSRIHNQLHVVRDLEDDDVLLQLRDLETNYRFDVRMGLSYTFGSIYNNIVNPRLGNGGW